jgi:hypothetical protein
MTEHELPQEVLARVDYGLRWVAGSEAPFLSDDTWRRMAKAALSHALSTGHIVQRADHDAERENFRAKVRRTMDRACAAENARDRTLVRVQATLHDLATDHPDLMPRLAEAAAQAGVCFSPGSGDA